jgi:hypothetical protein
LTLLLRAIGNAGLVEYPNLDSQAHLLRLLIGAVYREEASTGFAQFLLALVC